MREQKRVKRSMQLVFTAALVAAAQGACSDDTDDLPPASAPGPVTSVRIVAAQGGTVAAPNGSAVLTIPPGALASDVDITLAREPGAYGSMGEIYDFGPDGLQFLQPATLSIRAESSGRSLAIALLDGQTFRALEGSTFADSTAKAPLHHFSKYSTILVEDSDGGAVGEDSGGSNEPPPLKASSMTVEVDGQSYTFTTTNSGWSGGIKWQGPTVDAITSSNDAQSWPRTNPRLTVSVLFSGFLASAGFTPGTYDLASSSLTNLVVTLSAASQAEVPVGQTVPYAVYSSSATVDGAGSSNESTPAAGVTGQVTVTEYKQSTDPNSSGFDCDVTLSNVVLPIRYTGGSNPSYPATAKITSAHLVADARAN